MAAPPRHPHEGSGSHIGCLRYGPFPSLQSVQSAAAWDVRILIDSSEGETTEGVSQCHGIRILPGNTT